MVASAIALNYYTDTFVRLITVRAHMRKFTLFILLLALNAAYAASEDEANAAFERGDYVKAMELSIPLAEAGDPDALANIGNMHAFGWGVPIDRTKATGFWLKAAEKHVGTAMGNIASCYKTGSCGLERNDALAAEWYKSAAEHRHAPSMLAVSSIYMNGDGLPHDKVKSLAWASLAATNSRFPEITKAAKDQTYRIMSACSKDEVDSARRYSNELITLINENVAKYKKQ